MLNPGVTATALGGLGTSKWALGAALAQEAGRLGAAPVSLTEAIEALGAAGLNSGILGLEVAALRKTARKVSADRSIWEVWPLTRPRLASSWSGSSVV